MSTEIAIKCELDHDQYIVDFESPTVRRHLRISGQVALRSTLEGWFEENDGPISVTYNSDWLRNVEFVVKQARRRFWLKPVHCRPRFPSLYREK